LSALSSYTLQVLLGRGIGIANLKEETFFADGLAMELLDNLFADITGLEATTIIQSHCIGKRVRICQPRKTDPPAVIMMITKDSARTNSVIHKDSTKFLTLISAKEFLTLSMWERTDSVMILGKFET
jgi:hypothetical protein